MALLKKNIWLAFYLINLMCIGVLSCSVYITYKNIYTEVENGQRNIAEVSARAFKSLMAQHEVVIDVTATQLIRENALENLSVAETILNELSASNPAAGSLEIFLPDGTFYAASASVTLSDSAHRNALKSLDSQDIFQKEKEAKHLVLGRSYYNDTINKFVFPVRKAIRDTDGNILFILSSIIDIDKDVRSIKGDIPNDLQLQQDVSIMRDKDHYYQIAPLSLRNDTDIYNYQLPDAEIEELVNTIVASTGLSFDAVKQSEINVTHEHQHREKSFISVGKYINPYNLWLITEFDKDFVWQFLLKESKILVSIFAFALIIIYLLFRNISRNEEQKKRLLKHQATHDHLTHLHNRYYLDEKSKQITEDNPFSLLFIDMDNFKPVNDGFGHDIGDKVLVEVARRLQTLCGDNDTLIRYSGDEFIILFADNRSARSREFSKKVLHALCEPYLIRDKRFILSASIGVSSYPYDGDTLDEVMRNADLSMYEAKKDQDKIVFFNDKLKQEALYKVEVEHQLTTAVEKKELYMLYQPQMSVEGKIHGVEALIRWENEKLGFVPPDKFISISESSGLMPAVGLFAMERSILELDEVRRETGVDIQLSINISIKQFLHKSFFSDLIYILNKYKFNEYHLMLEITESIFIDDVIGIKSLISDLKDHGMHISLDDFGTGYSSLSMLKDLPIDELKVDKSFIDALNADPQSHSMVDSVINIAKKLGMITVVEGVETQEQLKIIKELGGDIVQGYYYSKPLKKDELKDFVLEHQ